MTVNYLQALKMMWKTGIAVHIVLPVCPKWNSIPLMTWSACSILCFQCYKAEACITDLNCIPPCGPSEHLRSFTLSHYGNQIKQTQINKGAFFWQSFFFFKHMRQNFFHSRHWINMSSNKGSILAWTHSFYFQASMKYLAQSLTEH